SPHFFPSRAHLCSASRPLHGPNPRPPPSDYHPRATRRRLSGPQPRTLGLGTRHAVGTQRPFFAVDDCNVCLSALRSSCPIAVPIPDSARFSQAFPSCSRLPGSCVPAHSYCVKRDEQQTGEHEPRVHHLRRVGRDLGLPDHHPPSHRHGLEVGIYARCSLEPYVQLSRRFEHGTLRDHNPNRHPDGQVSRYAHCGTLEIY
ncbi:hypothetical protein EXIGLDRAFT_829277, partial [Exidia glandulosa HHB12029]